eukprot:ctg_3151.g585
MVRRCHICVRPRSAAGRCGAGASGSGSAAPPSIAAAVHAALAVSGAALCRAPRAAVVGGRDRHRQNHRLPPAGGCVRTRTDHRQLSSRHGHGRLDRSLSAGGVVHGQARWWPLRLVRWRGGAMSVSVRTRRRSGGGGAPARGVPPVRLHEPGRRFRQARTVAGAAQPPDGGVGVERSHCRRSDGAGA